MPESRIRRKKGSAATPAATASDKPQVNGPLFLPVMLGLMIIGLLWIVVFYTSQQQYPIPGIGSWNLIAGFGFVLAGFMMTTRWR